MLFKVFLRFTTNIPSISTIKRPIRLPSPSFLFIAQHKAYNKLSSSMAERLQEAGFSLLGAFLFFLLCSYIPGTVISAKINVGGPANWTFGFNYTDWALKADPFHVNDTLVFKYDPPNSTTHAHSVYLVKDLSRFLSCNLKKAQLVGNVMQGGGEGFQFVLSKRKTYYFVCGEKQGFHCSTGLMKFSVRPAKRC